MPDETQNTEIILTHGDLRARVSPFGASLRGVWREDAGGRTDIITGYSGTGNKVGGQGDVLIPFPGRVRDGRYTFGGETFEMPKNDKDGPNAIHGFVRLALWEVAAQSESTVTFTIAPGERDGYPFALRVSVTYSLAETGFACRFAVTNAGTRPAPAAAGFHPYFSVGSATINTDTLHLPFAKTLEFADLLPTGRVLSVDGTEFDFREPRVIGATAFNTCFLDPKRDNDGLIRVRLTSGERAVTVWMDAAFDYVVVYSGDALPASHRRSALAIEPMTCGSDAFNHPEWGLSVLEPGQVMGGSWGVTA